MTKDLIFAKCLMFLRAATCLLGLSSYLLAQETDFRTKPLTIELLTMEGSKSNLKPNGEGVSSVQSTLLFKLGGTKVSAIEPSSRIVLPVGYTLFNDLAYKIETEAVVSGPHAIVFNLPLARTKEVFDRLRILHAELDEADPDKPRWSDVTALPDYSPPVESYFTKAQFEELLPNFEKRTIRAVTEQLGMFVVALKDSSLARDRFVADVGVEATSMPESVMEGRDLKYSYKITNNGPDTASSVRFHSFVGAEYISSETSQGTCRYGAGNIYCNLGEIAKGATATVRVTAKCGWPISDDQPTQPIRTEFEVQAAEGDSNYENNMRTLNTPVFRDPNKAPIVKIINPAQDQFFVGPGAKVKIAVSAHDPDGSVGKVEFFDRELSIGVGTLSGKDTYELIYDNVSFGPHWLTAKVTDDQGRENVSPGFLNFFVNGRASVEIISPTSNAVIPRSAGSVTVKVRASNPEDGIKRVSVSVFDLRSAGGVMNEALPIEKGVYAFKFDALPCMKLCGVQASVTDDAGIETLSAPLNFKVTDPPQVTLYGRQGESIAEIRSEAVFESVLGLDLIAKAGSFFESQPNIAKVEFYANGKLICTDVNSKETHLYYPFGDFRCWRPNLSPGKYTLMAVATDNDGVVGKSTPVEVIIR